MKVVAHHGTTRTAADAIKGSGRFETGTNNYDWLGTGAYFWQESALRAKVWARSITKGTAEKPAVLEADLDLDGCLDLFDLKDYRTLRDLYPQFVRLEGPAGPPRTQAGLIVQDGFQFTTEDSSTDPLTRKPIQNFRDCAFIDFAIEVLKASGRTIKSVRGVFLNGQALFAESFLFDWSHSQIVVLRDHHDAVISDIREV